MFVSLIEQVAMMQTHAVSTIVMRAMCMVDPMSIVTLTRVEARVVTRAIVSVVPVMSVASAALVVVMIVVLVVASARTC